MSHHRTHSVDEDADLAVVTGNGDNASFETLIPKYQNRLFNTAFRITGSYQDAGEVVRQVYVHAYRGGDTLFSGQERCFERLTGLVVSHCRNRSGVSPKGREGQAVGPVQDPHERKRFDRLTMHDRLQECIGMLPHDFREVLVLRDVQGLSYGDISVILKIMTETVMTRTVRAREMVRDCLKQGVGEVAAHPEFHHKFSAYLENSLSADEKEDIKRHLSGCGHCREELANLEWTIGHLRSLPTVESPPLLITRILEDLDGPPVAAAPHPGLREQFLPPLRAGIQIGIVAALVLCTAIYLCFRPGLQSHPSVSPSGTPLSLPVQPAPRQSSGSMPVLPDPGRGASPALVESPELSPQRHDAPRHPSSPQPMAASLPSRPAEEPQLQSPYDENEPELDGISLRSREKRAAPLVALQREKRSAERAPSSGELDVTLRVDDPAVASGAIEHAISRLGGRITGRAFTGGVDFLYSQIDGRKFAELMDRLGRIGKIQERPQSPEGGAGTVDLVIRW